MTAVGPTVVYGLCLLTSGLCAVLLLRAWRANRSKLLLWTGASFGFLAVNNLFLVLDRLVLTGSDLWAFRQGALVLAIGVLIYGFIWEVES